jgi:hypothetical protein
MAPRGDSVQFRFSPRPWRSQGRSSVGTRRGLRTRWSDSTASPGLDSVLASLRSGPTPTPLAHRFLVGNPNALHASLPAAGWTPLRFAKHFVRFERARPVAGQSRRAWTHCDRSMRAAAWEVTVTRRVRLRQVRSQPNSALRAVSAAFPEIRRATIRYDAF